MENKKLAPLMEQINKLHARHELHGHTPRDYFEPGMMEYLDKSDGLYDADTGKMILQFESKGTGHEGRTERIEKLAAGDAIRVVRDPDNTYNRFNFRLLTSKGDDVGNMPAELCNAIAPLYDSNELRLENARVSYVEPLSARNRHAKQAMLFVRLEVFLNNREETENEQ